MIRINIHDAKTHLSRYLAKLGMNEKIILCNRNIPVAEITALPVPTHEPRPLGLAQGEIQMLSTFFKKLPKQVEDSFYK